MLLHYLCKVNVQICDKLQTSCLMKRNISCHTIWQTMLLSSLQQLLEMSAFCPHTHSKMLTPLINCIVNDALVHAVPNVRQTVPQFVNAVQLWLTHLLLNVTPPVIDQIKVGAIRLPQICRNKSRCWLLKKSQCCLPGVQVCCLVEGLRNHLTSCTSWATAASSPLDGQRWDQWC